MAVITTRSGKGSALTSAEVDANFTNLNTDKAEKSVAISAGTGLTGGGDLSANRSLALASSGVVAGAYGGNNSIPVITFDATGRATVASTVTPSGTYGISVSGNAATATTLATARAINGVSFNGSADITVADATKLPLAGGTMTGAIAFAAGQTWPTFNQSTTGNASTATTLQTARLINGVSFNGSADITVADATKLPLAGGTMTGAIAFAAGQTWPTFNQNTTGSAATLTTTRAINGTNFNGSAAITTANWGTARTLWGQSVNGSANITAPLLPAAGTAALPALSTSGDTNTGIFFPAADTIGFAEGGAEVMRIDSAGNVGIGTASPGASLHVAGAIAGVPLGTGVLLGVENNYATVHLNGSNGGIIDISVSGVDFKGRILYDNVANGMTFSTNGAERMRLDASGNVGIGAIPTGLVANGKALAIGDSDTGIRQNGDGTFEVVANNVIRGVFSTNAQFYSSLKGNWSARTALVQDDSTSDSQPAVAFHAPANGSAGILKFFGIGNRFEFRNASDSGFHDVYGLAFVNASDYRLKENIQPSQVGLQAVMALQPVKFNWKNNDKDVIGFIAHEAQAVVPEAVTGEKDGINPISSQPDFQGMKDSVMIAVLVKAVQELKTEFDAYKLAHA